MLNLQKIPNIAQFSNLAGLHSAAAFGGLVQPPLPTLVLTSGVLSPSGISGVQLYIPTSQGEPLNLKIFVTVFLKQILIIFFAHSLKKKKIESGFRIRGASGPRFFLIF